MKRIACRIFYCCLLAMPLSACFPVPKVAPVPSIIGLDQNLKQVAAGDCQAQTKLARNFLDASNGLGKDLQAAQRLLYAAADGGDVNAQGLLTIRSLQPNRALEPDEMMESAYWFYQLAQGGDRLFMMRLATLYAKPDFPAYSLVESCKWRLLARQACDEKYYSAEIFQQASQRAQPLLKQFSK